MFKPNRCNYFERPKRCAKKLQMFWILWKTNQWVWENQWKTNHRWWSKSILVGFIFCLLLDFLVSRIDFELSIFDFVESRGGAFFRLDFAMIPIQKCILWSLFDLQMQKKNKWFAIWINCAICARQMFSNRVKMQFAEWMPKCWLIW